MALKPRKGVFMRDYYAFAAEKFQVPGSEFRAIRPSELQTPKRSYLLNGTLEERSLELLWDWEPGTGNFSRFFPITAFGGQCHKDVLQRRPNGTNVHLGNAGSGEFVANRLFGNALFNQQMHGLAENGGSSNTRQMAQHLQPTRDMVTSDIEPFGVGRINQWQLFQIVGLTANHEFRHINIANV